MPLRPYQFGSIDEPVHELRDLAIFEGNGRIIFCTLGLERLVFADWSYLLMGCTPLYSIRALRGLT